MSIYVGTSEIKNIYVGTTPVKEVYVGTTKVRPVIPPYLCFTANTAGSKVTLNSTGSPTAVTLEKSTDGTTWTNYSIGQTITLSNIGDKICFRNTSTTNTGFSTSGVNYYYFSMDGSISASGDACYLLNKNGTTTLSTYCFYSLFKYCTSLTTSPSLGATTLGQNCYSNMFQGCTNLTTIPKLPRTGSLPNYCYNLMFYGCSKIKLSTTQTGEYQTEYRVPTSGTAISGTGSSNNMFANTGGTFTGVGGNKVLNFNTTYYTSNTLV